MSPEMWHAVIETNVIALFDLRKLTIDGGTLATALIRRAAAVLDWPLLGLLRD